MRDERVPLRGERLGWVFAGPVLRTPPLAVGLRRAAEDLIRVVPGGRPEAIAPRLPRGQVRQPIEVDEDRLRKLLLHVLIDPYERVVWVSGGHEAVVELASLRVAVRTGMVLLGLPLATEQHRGELTVPIAVGTPDRITGMMAVAPRAPNGPAALVVAWGDAVIAALWGALVDVARALAAASGEDEDGVPLAPTAMLAEDRVLGIVAQSLSPARTADRNEHYGKQRRP